MAVSWDFDALVLFSAAAWWAGVLARAWIADRRRLHALLEDYGFRS